MCQNVWQARESRDVESLFCILHLSEATAPHVWHGDVLLIYQDRLLSSFCTLAVTSTSTSVRRVRVIVCVSHSCELFLSLAITSRLWKGDKYVTLSCLCSPGCLQTNQKPFFLPKGPSDNNHDEPPQYRAAPS